MKRHFYILAAIIFLAISSGAHPLGNFSVNQYSRLEVDKTRIRIRQILDMAEIPTFQLRDEIDTDKNGSITNAELKLYAEQITPEILSNLFLTVNDQPLAIRAESKNAALSESAGGLQTLRIEWSLSGDLKDLTAVNRVRFENRNFADRIGWNEIVLTPAVGGVNIFDSTAWGSSLSDELKSYPPDTLAAPLAEKSASFAFSTNAVPENAKPLADRDGRVAAVRKDRLAELINVPEITPAIALFGLLVAVGLGALHAMSPGHGKTVVGAYLVGSRGTAKHAAFLGLTVTVTHTLGVFALGLVTLFASNYILPEKLMPFLGFVSGLLVLYIGLTLFKSRLFAALGWENAGDQPHHHGEHSHNHGHAHAHYDHGHHTRRFDAHA